MTNLKLGKKVKLIVSFIILFVALAILLIVSDLRQAKKKETFPLYRENDRLYSERGIRKRDLMEKYRHEAENMTIEEAIGSMPRAEKFSPSR
ncbi:MAG: hypothetical protein ABH869_05695 [Candidatus Omnitrophota bacterium]